MSLMFEDDSLAPVRPRRSQRTAAVLTVALVMLSWGFLGRLAAETSRPVQSVAWVFGPAPAAQPVQ
jgi:hypothetical protein